VRSARWAVHERDALSVGGRYGHPVANTDLHALRCLSERVAEGPRCRMPDVWSVPRIGSGVATPTTSDGRATEHKERDSPPLCAHGRTIMSATADCQCAAARLVRTYVLDGAAPGARRPDSDYCTRWLERYLTESSTTPRPFTSSTLAGRGRGARAAETAARGVLRGYVARWSSGSLGIRVGDTTLAPFASAPCARHRRYQSSNGEYSKSPRYR
jgi:hypothetical protein